MENFKKMKALCDRLSSLLDDPHPGLSTWWEFTVKTASELRAMINEELDSK